jgi:hypothetical protein
MAAAGAPLQEALALAAVGQCPALEPAATQQEQLVEALGQLARLGMPEDDRPAQRRQPRAAAGA